MRPGLSVSCAISSSCAPCAHPCLSPPVLDCSPILSSFQVILLEHIIMCRLVTGHKATALQEVRPRSGVGVCCVSEAVTWVDVSLPSACWQDICPCHFTVTGSS